VFSRDMDEAVKRYEKRLDELGLSPQTLGWRSKRQQYVRFEILAEIGDLHKHSVLDLGCGFGDFYEFLSAKGLDIDYTGYDISPKFVAIAKGRHSNLHFEVKDILKDPVERKFDYIVSSGIFNYKISNNEQFIRELFRKSLELSNLGVAHNMLSSCVDYRDANLYYADSSEILSFCQTLSRRVTLRHDYMPFEFTAYVYKDDEKDSENIFKNYDYQPT
jgi:SAM-dependent methyltransferase